MDSPSPDPTAVAAAAQDATPRNSPRTIQGALFGSLTQEPSQTDALVPVRVLLNRRGVEPAPFTASACDNDYSPHRHPVGGSCGASSIPLNGIVGAPSSSPSLLSLSSNPTTSLFSHRKQSLRSFFAAFFASAQNAKHNNPDTYVHVHVDDNATAKAHSTRCCGWLLWFRRMDSTSRKMHSWTRVVVVLVTLVTLLALLLVALTPSLSSHCGASSSNSRMCTASTPLLHVLHAAAGSEEDAVASTASPILSTSTSSSSFSVVAHLPRDMGTLSPSRKNATTDFVEHVTAALQTIQWLAIASWLKLVPARHLLLFMDTQAACDNLRLRSSSSRPELPALEEAQCFAVPCLHPETGQPLMDCLLHMASSHARTDILAFVNGADGNILLDESLGDAVRFVRTNGSSSNSSNSNSSHVREHQRRREGEHFLVVSRHTTIELSAHDDLLRTDRAINTDPITRLFALARSDTKAKLQQGGQVKAMIDVFVFRKSMLGLLHFDPTERARLLYGDLYPPSYDLAAASTQPDHVLRLAAPEALHFAPFVAGAFHWVRHTYTTTAAAIATLDAHLLPLLPSCSLPSCRFRCRCVVCAGQLVSE
jgi:hypothetical protein